MGLQLLPVSRERVEYTLLPYARGTWVRPSLKVVDRYFNKTLKTLPAGKGCAAEKGVLVVWVPKELLPEPEAEEDEDEGSEEDSDFEPSASSEDSLEYAEESDEDGSEGEGREDDEEAKQEENQGKKQEEDKGVDE